MKVYKKLGPYDEDGDDEIAAAQLAAWGKDYNVRATLPEEDISCDLFIK
mgnify:CR=1 FL=1